MALVTHYAAAELRPHLAAAWSWCPSAARLPSYCLMASKAAAPAGGVALAGSNAIDAP